MGQNGTIYQKMGFMGFMGRVGGLLSPPTHTSLFHGTWQKKLWDTLKKIWDIWDYDITTMAHEIASDTCKMYYTASSQALQRPFYASECHALST